MRLYERVVARAACLAVMLTLGAAALPAQERPARVAQKATVATTPVIVVSGARQPESRIMHDRSSPPSSLSNAEKAEIFRVALDLPQLSPAGIGAGIRLTPSQPFLSGKGRLELVAPLTVTTAENGGQAVVPNSASGWISSVACSFRPSVVNQSLLVDMSISMYGTGKIRLYSPSGQFEQILELSTGAQHLTAIFKPADLNEHSLVASYMEKGSGTYFTFYACEITPLLKP